MFGGPAALQAFTMRVHRIGLVPVSSMDRSVRRYRLARLEEVALATPPESGRYLNGHRNGRPGPRPRGEAEGAGAR
jgi:hypothetical protein